jgi:hypothetical protein
MSNEQPRPKSAKSATPQASNAGEARSWQVDLVTSEMDRGPTTFVVSGLLNRKVDQSAMQQIPVYPTRHQRRSALDFEDMDPRDWPAHLKALHNATRAAYTMYAELDAIHVAIQLPEVDTTLDERGPIYSLTGQAYNMLTALRAAGAAQVALREQHEAEDWEAEQARRAVEGRD